MRWEIPTGDARDVTADLFADVRPRIHHLLGVWIVLGPNARHGWILLEDLQDSRGGH